MTDHEPGFAALTAAEELSASGLTRTFDLAKCKYAGSYSLSPREAVIAAHAQSLGDYNTWDYEERYGSLVTVGLSTVRCGNFTALLS